ncbi:MAG: FtsQ-type POTRA domain-containing protein [Clostridiales Family XIII bacterium]|jgi:cell division protein FtsQ|nr:FtsQ-type POTRA domain-containing protein [Clostridiales Family XIII bacterium]
MRYTEENRRKRGKRKKKRYLLKIGIAVLALVGLYYLAMSSFFDIETITVENNSYFTSAQVAELSGVKKGDNLFKTRTGPVREQLTQNPYIREAEVQRVLPDEIHITVDERSEDVVVRAENAWLVVDYDGVILRSTDDPPILPAVDGLTAVNPEPGKALKVKEADMLAPCLDFFAYMEEHDFYIKRLDTGGVITKAYIFDNLICEGDLKNIEKSVENLKKVVADLSAKGVERGTISVNGSGTCSFTPELE